HVLIHVCGQALPHSDDVIRFIHRLKRKNPSARRRTIWVACDRTYKASSCDCPLIPVLTPEEEPNGRQWTKGHRPRPPAHECDGAKGHRGAEQADRGRSRLYAFLGAA